MDQFNVHARFNSNWSKVMEFNIRLGEIIMASIDNVGSAEENERQANNVVAALNDYFTDPNCHPELWVKSSGLVDREITLFREAANAIEAKAASLVRGYGRDIQMVESSKNWL